MSELRQNLDSLFQILSRVIIIVPLVAILIALILKLSGNQNLTINSLQSAPTPTKIQSNPLSNLPQSFKMSSDSAKFNLQGPLICSYITDSASMSAYIKDKRVLFKAFEKNSTQNILLKDDCIYIWQMGNFSGEKICGISQYVGLAESFLSIGIFDPSLILNSVGKVIPIPSLPAGQDSIKTLLNSCRNESIPKAVQFAVPNNILFKNKKIK